MISSGVGQGCGQTATLYGVRRTRRSQNQPNAPCGPEPLRISQQVTREYLAVIT